MKKNKNPQTKELPPLCVAVKRTREAYKESQDGFARRVDVALMTISRFETGRAVPRDPRVLVSLFDVATVAGLEKEAKLFYTAYVEERGNKKYFPTADELFAKKQESSTVVALLPAHSLQQWRLMAAVRVAALYYPDRISA